MNMSNSLIFTLLGICSVVVVASVVLPEHHPLNPASYTKANFSEFSAPDMMTTENEKKVPLYVYTGTPVTSRKWSSFYDRRHTGSRSPLLDMIATTHQSHHTIGPIVPIDDEYLMGVLKNVATPDTIRTIAGERGQVSLQHDRILRDALLFYVVCKGGGILIPSNVILLGSTGVIWEELLKTPKDTILVFSEDGNSEYGCPILVTRQNTNTCETVATVLFGSGANKEFYGGIGFSGGSSVIFERLTASGLPIRTLGGVRTVRTDELTEMKPLPYEIRRLSMVVIPFEQGSGKTSIPRRDQWMYSDSPEGILKNPTVLREILILSRKNGSGVR